MSKSDNLALAEVRVRLHDYMLGHAHAEADRIATLDLPGWAVAARIELIRRHPLVVALDDELLAAIASRAIDPGIEARHLALRLRDVGRDIAAETGQGGEGGPSARARRPTLPTTALGQMETTLALIARAHLDLRLCMCVTATGWISGTAACGASWLHWSRLTRRAGTLPVDRAALWGGLGARPFPWAGRRASALAGRNDVHVGLPLPLRVAGQTLPGPPARPDSGALLLGGPRSGR